MGTLRLARAVFKLLAQLNSKSSELSWHQLPVPSAECAAAGAGSGGGTSALAALELLDPVMNGKSSICNPFISVISTIVGKSNFVALDHDRFTRCFSIFSSARL